MQMTSTWGSHTINESCQTNYTCCMTLLCTHTHTITCIGGFIVCEVFNERIYMWNWFEGCMVAINGVFNVSTTEQLSVNVECKYGIKAPYFTNPGDDHEVPN